MKRVCALLVVQIAATSGMVPSVSAGKQPLSGQHEIVVSPNVHVSRANADRPHQEVLIAADPNDPRRLIGVTIIHPQHSSDSSFHTVAVYASFDGGDHWEPVLEHDGGKYGASDPACIYGPDGTAYFALITLEPKLEQRGTVIYKSQDGGRTWDAPVTLPFIDRPYLAADQSKGKYHGRIYLNGVEVRSSLLHESTRVGFHLFTAADRDAPFLQSATSFRSPNEPPLQGIGMGNGVVLSDGTYAAIFSEDYKHRASDEGESGAAGGAIKLITSVDGGRTLSSATTISDWHVDYRIPSLTRTGIPVLAVDSSGGPFADRLYAVWSDYRSGRSEILLAASADGGTTWSEPTVVSDDRSINILRSGPDDTMPAVAVNKNGVVGVMWYDRRDNPDNLGYWTRFSASLDGGETFLPSVRISQAATAFGENSKEWLGTVVRGGGTPSNRGGALRVLVRYPTFAFNGGHTAGIAADADGNFHPLWIDNRTGVTQTWSAKVTVKGKAIRNGSTDLSQAHDSTAKVTLEMTNASWQPAKGVVVVEAWLVNTSRETIKGPVKVRVLSLRSNVGIPRILNAENGRTGTGAVWSFSGTLKEGKLNPGERGERIPLEFALSDMRPLTASAASGVLRDLIELKVKVLTAPY